MQDDRRPGKLHILVVFQPSHYAVQTGQKEVLERLVANVSRRYQQQLERLTAKEQRVDEVGILRDYDPQLSNRKLIDLAVIGPVGARQLQGMDRVVPAFSQVERKAAGKVSIHQELHAAAGSIRFTRVTLAA